MIISGKKNSKKILKKTKMQKSSSNAKSSTEQDSTPIRQSRRIAQMKIKEEADRRHLEEVALRELKKIHKKKVFNNSNKANKHPI